MQFQQTYIACPHCGKWYSHLEVVSFTVHGNSECWSDGECVNQSTSEYQRVYNKCEACEAFFWFDDCKRIEDFIVCNYLDNNEIGKLNKEVTLAFLRDNPAYAETHELKNLLNYPPAYYLDSLEENLIKDFQIFLNTDKSDEPEKEIYLRTRLWQTINDFHRYDKNPFLKHVQTSSGLKSFFNFSKLKAEIRKVRRNKKADKKYGQLKQENLQRLSDLLEKEAQDDNLLLIEVYRQARNFKKAKELIKNATPSEKKESNKFLRKSLKLIAEKSVRVFRLN